MFIYIRKCDMFMGKSLKLYCFLKNSYIKCLIIFRNVIKVV